MKDSDSIFIYEWMVKRLKLKSNELIVYAFLYDGSEILTYTGTIKYIADSLCITSRSVSKILRSLNKKGLLNER